MRRRETAKHADAIRNAWSERGGGGAWFELCYDERRRRSIRESLTLAGVEPAEAEAMIEEVAAIAMKFDGFP